MTNDQIFSCSDTALLVCADRAAAAYRTTTVNLIRLLVEVERRRLHLGLGYPSLFMYCSTRLRLSEAAAFGRITAARLSRRFPQILDLLAEGSLTLSGVNKLAAHLNDKNVDALLAAAKRKSTREIERLVAGIHPMPDVPASVRAMPVSRAASSSAAPSGAAPSNAAPLSGARSSAAPSSEAHPAAAPPAAALPAAGAPGAVARSEAPESSLAAWSLQPESTPADPISSPDVRTSPWTCSATPRAVLSPLTPDRYLLKVTIGRSTQQKLEKLRSLLRHRVPNGDPAAIVEQAIALLLDRVESERCAEIRRTARIRRPHATDTRSSAPRGRYIPSPVRRAVWARDQSRCAFVGGDGRCEERGFLEIHHVIPFGSGGPSTLANLELRCRAHNAYEAVMHFGPQSAS